MTTPNPAPAATINATLPTGLNPDGSPATGADLASADAILTSLSTHLTRLCQDGIFRLLLIEDRELYHTISKTMNDIHKEVEKRDEEERKQAQDPQERLAKSINVLGRFHDDDAGIRTVYCLLTLGISSPTPDYPVHVEIQSWEDEKKQNAFSKDEVSVRITFGGTKPGRGCCTRLYTWIGSYPHGVGARTVDLSNRLYPQWRAVCRACGLPDTVPVSTLAITLSDHLAQDPINKVAVAAILRWIPPEQGVEPTQAETSKSSTTSSTNTAETSTTQSKQSQLVTEQKEPPPTDIQAKKSE